jgi:anthranilate phosphoribosyltransferase
MFAPQHHQATRFVVPVRKALGVQTIFNFLGPLTNPAGATRQLIGVSDPRYMDLMAGALVRLGAEHALVVSGEDGMDEVSIVGETRVVEVTPDGIRSYSVVPEQVGLTRADPESLVGGTPERCAEIVGELLEGASGSRRALAVINAGAALLVAEKAPDLEQGVRLAEEAIDSGAARDALDRFVAKTVELAPERDAQAS